MTATDDSRSPSTCTIDVAVGATLHAVRQIVGSALRVGTARVDIRREDYSPLPDDWRVSVGVDITLMARIDYSRIGFEQRGVPSAEASEHPRRPVPPPPIASAAAAAAVAEAPSASEPRAAPKRRPRVPSPTSPTSSPAEDAVPAEGEGPVWHVRSIPVLRTDSDVAIAWDTPRLAGTLTTPGSTTVRQAVVEAALDLLTAVRQGEYVVLDGAGAPVEMDAAVDGVAGQRLQVQLPPQLPPVRGRRWRARPREGLRAGVHGSWRNAWQWALMAWLCLGRAEAYCWAMPTSVHHALMRSLHGNPCCEDAGLLARSEEVSVLPCANCAQVARGRRVRYRCTACDARYCARCAKAVPETAESAAAALADESCWRLPSFRRALCGCQPRGLGARLLLAEDGQPLRAEASVRAPAPCRPPSEVSEGAPRLWPMPTHFAEHFTAEVVRLVQLADADALGLLPTALLWRPRGARGWQAQHTEIFLRLERLRAGDTVQQLLEAIEVWPHSTHGRDRQSCFVQASQRRDWKVASSALDVENAEPVDWPALWKMLAPSACSPPNESARMQTCLSPYHLMEALRRMRSRSATGPSAWSVSLLRLLPQPVLMSFLSLLIDSRPAWLVRTRVVPVPKAAGGHRPIVLEEMPLRLFSAATARQVRWRAHYKCGLKQLALAPGGAASLYEHARQWRDEGLVVVKLDISNAFSHANRREAFAALWDLAPSARSALQFLADCQLCCDGHPITGLPQGDPMSMVAFSTLLRRRIDAAALPSCVRVSSFADDIVLAAAPQDIPAAVRALSASLQVVGLSINHAKTEAISPLPELDDLQQLSVTSSIDLMGGTMDDRWDRSCSLTSLTVVRTEGEVPSAAAKRLARLQRRLRTATEWWDSAAVPAVRWAILCWIAVVVPMAFAWDFTVLEHAAALPLWQQAFDSLSAFVLHLHPGAGRDLVRWLVLQPRKHCGFSLLPTLPRTLAFRLRHLMCSARNAPDLVRLLRQKERLAVHNSLRELHITVTTVREVSEAALLLERRRAFLPAPTLKAIQANSRPWRGLLAPPAWSDYASPLPENHGFQLWLLWRVGLPVFAPGCRCPLRTATFAACLKPLDVGGRHAVGCLCGGMRVWLHNSLVQLLRDAAVWAGCSTQLEPPVLVQCSDGLRLPGRPGQWAAGRADLKVWLPAPTYFDVTTVLGTEDMSAARKTKLCKYGQVVCPVVFTLGGLGDDLLRLFDTLDCRAWGMERACLLVDQFVVRQLDACAGQPPPLPRGSVPRGRDVLALLRDLAG